ncbi:HAMP domain-containing sensor histidine kinase [Actinomadura sediminis]|uniref:Signal transduction histidine-protein kinase/phosphatase MprB n=1 Tax=Actinomadura sediminis TaxID=1038904 RepID=A0ABW3ESW3_9ACTN
MRGTLALVAFAVTTMVAVSFLLPLGLVVKQIARDRALTGAERQAASLIPVLAITADPDVLADAVASTEAGADGRLALHLPSATVGTPHAAPGDVAAARDGGRAFVAGLRGGEVLLRPVVRDGAPAAVVEVFVPGAELSRGVTEAWLTLAGVALALGAVAVAMGDRLATRVVRSSRRLADAAGRVGAGDLDVRVTPDGPRELRAAATAFNTMAEQVAGLLATERETAADLSHRLRTPLTALRLSIDGLVANPGDPRRLDRGREALARLEGEIDALIAAARRPRPQAAGCDAADVVRERLEFWSALAEDQGRPHQLIAPDGPVPVPVARAELVAAIDALMGNVFRHTPRGAGFTVTVHRGRHAVGLLFADAGPGIADERAALRRGTSGAGSTGLGLDIARRLAAATGGSLRVDRSPQLGGARIQMWLRTEPDAPGRAKRGRRTGPRR